MKEKIVVICPGRGVYNKSELNYLSRFHSSQKDFIEKIDQFRSMQGQLKISELDSSSKYQSSIHSAGENAASLIYTCAYLDYLAIDKSKYEVSAITGNSMGWYLALACGEALNTPSSFDLINTMGSMLKDGLIGGQIIYPIVDENWIHNNQLENTALKAITSINNEEGCEAYISIQFGGYIVIGANQNGLKKLMKDLPPVQERFPMKLTGNAAFHTPLFDDIVPKAKSLLNQKMFSPPKVSLIDGRGKIWHPLMSEVDKLYDYTLGDQVSKTYDFTRAIEMSLKEYAPDKLVLLGPGTTMGGAIGQILIKNNWLGIQNKKEFIEIQSQDPYLISMGDLDQRKLVTK